MNTAFKIALIERLVFERKNEERKILYIFSNVNCFKIAMLSKVKIVCLLLIIKNTANHLFLNYLVSSYIVVQLNMLTNLV